MTRGEKFMKPAPRSGSLRMIRLTVKVLSPSNSSAPSGTASASSSVASTQAWPGCGMSLVKAPFESGCSLTRRRPRNG